MATFAATVERLTIEPHHNADALELAVVGNYRAIVRKGQFQTGDLGVYIPEQSLVPDWLIKKLGLEGRLAGKQQNRVKAIKLRGVLSQGLIVPLPRRVELAWIELTAESDAHGFLDVQADNSDGIMSSTPGRPTISSFCLTISRICDFFQLVCCSMGKPTFSPTVRESNRAAY